MKTPALLGGLLWAAVGLAVELPQPVLFVNEMVEVITAGETPRAFHGAREYELGWSAEPLAEGIRWRGSFPPDAPLGPWYVRTGRTCFSFLRVPADRAILLLRGIPGMECEAAGEARVADTTGLCWFVLPPGTHLLHAEFPDGNEVERELTLAAGERRELVLASLELEPVAPVALPGHPFLVVLRVVSPVDVPTFTLAAELPPGWEMRIRGPCRKDWPCLPPVYAGVATEIELVFEVPPDALGTYRVPLHIPALDDRLILELAVAPCLDPMDVVRHWDVEAGDLDLGSRGGVGFAQLLWAAAQVGKRLPYSCRTFTQKDLEALAAEWASED